MQTMLLRIPQFLGARRGSLLYLGHYCSPQTHAVRKGWSEGEGKRKGKMWDVNRLPINVSVYFCLCDDLPAGLRYFSAFYILDSIKLTKRIVKNLTAKGKIWLKQDRKTLKNVFCSVIKCNVSIWFHSASNLLCSVDALCWCRGSSLTLLG